MVNGNIWDWNRAIEINDFLSAKHNLFSCVNFMKKKKQFSIFAIPYV